jgi:hypothetical protein
MAFRSLREILPEAVQGLAIAGRLRAELALQAWPPAARSVSGLLGERSRAIALDGTTLLVRVQGNDSASLAAARHAELVAALNARLGAPVVSALAVQAVDHMESEA